jgi:hypothetical protein
LGHSSTILQPGLLLLLLLSLFSNSILGSFLATSSLLSL